MGIGGVFLLLAEVEAFLILGLVFCLIAAIFSIVGLVQIGNHPDQYYGTGSAILNIVVFVLLMLLILLLLA
jgi:hypothetical protein